MRAAHAAVCTLRPLPSAETFPPHAISQVFFTESVMEAYDQGYTAKEATVRALAHTGNIICAAGIIMGDAPHLTLGTHTNAAHTKPQSLSPRTESSHPVSDSVPPQPSTQHLSRPAFAACFRFGAEAAGRGAVGWAGRPALRRGNSAMPRRSSSSDMASAAPRRASISQGSAHSAATSVECSALPWLQPKR